MRGNNRIFSDNGNDDIWTWRDHQLQRIIMNGAGDDVVYAGFGDDVVRMGTEATEPTRSSEMTATIRSGDPTATIGCLVETVTTS